MKHIHGLTVDEDKIARGVYDIICARGEEALVAFGMLPAWAMDTVHKALRDKILEETAQRLGVDSETLAPHVDEAALEKIVRDVEHEIAVAIYRTAAQAGKMVV